ncbi:MAG: class I SAM-dependent methyltransferase [Saprospiraceae bacterium]
MERERRGKGKRVKGGNSQSPLKAIRNSYADMGVDAYYLKNGKHYKNPHFKYIQQLLLQNESRIDYSSVLDFCCGSGEVSQVLQTLGYKDSTGCDPYTQKAYSLKMEKTCLGYTFEDVIKGKLEDQKYSSVICSFAMHLCEPKQLYPLVHQLFQRTEQVVIITPHKRPALEELDGVELSFEDFVLTERGKRVRLRAFRKSH